MTPYSLLTLLGWIMCTFVAPAIGYRARPDAWYRGLTKPKFNPPAWIFAPVWTGLYLLMAVAAWLVWRRGGWHEQVLPLTLYLFQLLLNAAWAPIFFGRHRIGFAFVEITMQWLAIAATLFAFAAVDRLAAWLFVPYLAWVSFATVLNFELWRRNR
jgi:translocator protein